MKTMTCRQLAGACDQEFRAETFEEIAKMSERHATELSKKGDEAHSAKMEEMSKLMRKPGAFEKWYEEMRRAFDDLPED